MGYQAYRHGFSLNCGSSCGSRASLVVCGATRLPAAVASQLHTFTAAELASADLEQWRIVRARGEQRRWPRVLGRRFRQDPDAYLQDLEERLIKLSLPP